MQANTYDKLQQILICETSDFWRPPLHFQKYIYRKNEAYI